jgi:hypothetical protein
MADLSSVRAALEAAIITNTSVTAAVVRPLSRDEKLTAGETNVSVVPSLAGYAPDSNTNFYLANYVITVVHRLSDPTDENTYLNGSMETDQEYLMARSSYRALSGVKDVGVEPMPEEISRTGNVIEYTVTVQLLITP